MRNSVMHASGRVPRAPSTLQGGWVRTLFLTLCALALAGVVALLMTEAGLRFYEKVILESPPVPANKGVVHMPSQNPGRVYELTPNAHMVRDGISFRINSLGMRDDEPPPYEKISGKKILVIGDSVAWGWGVPMDEAFPQRLEAALVQTAQQRGEGRPVVFNAGVDGYSLRQEVAYLWDIGFKLRPDLIVVAYVLNDPANEQDGGLRRHFQSELFLSRYLRVARERMWELSLGGDVPEEFFQRIHYVHKDGVRDDLAGVKAVADKIGAQVVLLVCPIFRFKATESYPWRNIDMDLKQFSEELGIGFIDVWPQFEGLDSSEVEADFQHPNSRGHALIAVPLIEAVTSRLYPDVTTAVPATQSP